jgi:trimeric autotransporter adhesin
MIMRSIQSTLILLGITWVMIVLCGCGGKNGLLGTAGGAALTGVTLTPVNPTVTLSASPMATQQFNAVGQYSFGNPQDITAQLTWVSADTTVAIMNSQGLATAVGSGRVIITGSVQDPVTLKTYQVSTILTVVPQLTSIALSPANAQIARGTTQQFTATGKYNDGTSSEISALVTWNSTQPAAATVSSSPGTQGLALAAAPGSTGISASLAGVSSSPSSLTVSPANLVSIAVAPANQTVPLATSQQLVATGTFDDGTSQNLSNEVTWATLNAHSQVARITATGMVAGLGLGSETVTATDSLSGLSASASVTVDESSVAEIRVKPVGMVMFPHALVPVPVMANGTRQQMRAVATFKDGSTLDVTDVLGIAWSSTNAGVANVIPETGLLTTTGPGSTTVTAALGSQQGSTSLSVVTAALQSLVVAPNNGQVPLGGFQNVVALATFLAADNLTVFQQDVSDAAAWSADANATVSYVNGLEELAIGAATGAANISANLGIPGGSAIQASATLNVSSAQLGAINLVPGSAAFPLNGSQQFVAMGNYTDGTQENLNLLATWGTSDERITAISPFGFANAMGPGQTDISVSFLNPVTGFRVVSSGSVVVNPAALARIDVCAASVTNPLTNCPPLDPSPTPPAISFANQTMFGLVAIGTFSDGSRQDLTDAVHWGSANPEVATASNDPGIPGITTGVGRNGVLSGGIQGGTALITATAGGISGSTTVSVSNATPQSISIMPANGIVALGTPQQYAVVGTYSDGSTQDVTASAEWGSLNPDVAIVTPGGLAYSTGRGIADVFQSPSSLAVTPQSVTVTMVNPSTTNAFPWPVGSVIRFRGLTVTSGDVSLLNDTPLSILAEYNPMDSQHLQPCQTGQNCSIQLTPPSPAPDAGIYTVLAGTGQASAVIDATINVIVNGTLTQFSGTTTLTVQ